MIAIEQKGNKSNYEIINPGESPYHLKKNIEIISIIIAILVIKSI